MGNRYGLSSLRTAEIRRGAVFHEGFSSAQDMLQNGAVFTGTKVSYPTVRGVKTVIAWLKAPVSGATTIKLNAGVTITIAAGEVFGSYTNATAQTCDILEVDKWRDVKDVILFSEVLDSDEIAAYQNKIAFQEIPSIWLPMQIEDHDITNVRTLDRSGLMNHATLGDGSTSTTYPAKRTTGSGYTFDGTTDYMQSRDTIAFTNSCTFGALCRFDAQSLRTVLSHGDTGDLFVLGAGVEGGVGTNNILNFAMYSGSWKVASTGIIPCIGKIYSLVGTYDGTTLKVYLDGKYMGSNTAAPDNRSFAVRVGRRFAAGTPNYFDGDVFEVLVSQRCLTATQVLDWDIRARECVRGC